MDAVMERSGGCCHRGLARATPEALAAARVEASATAREDLVPMCAVPGGIVTLGSSDGLGYASDGEGPQREVGISPFRMDATAVTNAQFARFVRATGYRTEAEAFGWSLVFYALVHPQAHAFIERGTAVALAPWWIAVRGACWHAPEGPGSDAAAIPDHPVIHVSWADARAFARWAGKQLPTEAQWEAAARGGLAKAIYPWGDELTPGGQHRCNIWQGQFPRDNSADDGYLGTAPVRSYEPNGYGLYNMVGNVWEWCADWWSPSWHGQDNTHTRSDPQGPQSGTGRVIRGGSYLCHASYCHRYRVSARSFSTPDSSTGHMGFRCCAGA